MPRIAGDVIIVLQLLKYEDKNHFIELLYPQLKCDEMIS